MAELPLPLSPPGRLHGDSTCSCMSASALTAGVWASIADDQSCGQHRLQGYQKLCWGMTGLSSNCEITSICHKIFSFPRAPWYEKKLGSTRRGLPCGAFTMVSIVGRIMALQRCPCSSQNLCVCSGPGQGRIKFSNGIKITNQLT